MKRYSLLTLLLSCISLSAAWAVQPVSESAEEAKDMIAIASVPQAVQQAIKKAAGSVAIAEVEKEDDDGVTIYEAGWKVGEVDHEVMVNEAGHVMATEMSVSGAAVPEAVRKAAAKHLPQGAKAEFEVKHVVLYEIEAMVDGKEIELLVDPSGRVMELEADDDHQDHDGDEDHDDDDKD